MEIEETDAVSHILIFKFVLKIQNRLVIIILSDFFYIIRNKQIEESSICLHTFVLFGENPSQTDSFVNPFKLATRQFWKLSIIYVVPVLVHTHHAHKV